MPKLILVLLLALTSVAVLAQQTTTLNSDPKARAQEVLNKRRPRSGVRANPKCRAFRSTLIPAARRAKLKSRWRCYCRINFCAPMRRLPEPAFRLSTARKAGLTTNQTTWAAAVSVAVVVGGMLVAGVARVLLVAPIQRRRRWRCGGGRSGGRGGGFGGGGGFAAAGVAAG